MWIHNDDSVVDADCNPGSLTMFVDKRPVSAVTQ